MALSWALLPTKTPPLTRNFCATRASYFLPTATRLLRIITRRSLKPTAPRCIPKRTSSIAKARSRANSSAFSSGIRRKCSRTSTQFSGRPRKSDVPQLNPALKRDFAESQRVGDDGDGAEAHRGTGEHGTEQQAEGWIEDACGDGDADDVVEEREEKVLLDVADRRAAQLASANDAAQVALHQRDAGAFDGNVGAGAHGDSDVGCG